MGSRRPFGSILGGFSKVLGRFWDGFGTDLGDFWNGFALILERIWYMRGNWFWTWTWAWMQRFGLLCAFSLGKKHISVEPTLHFNQSLSMSGPPRCLAKLRGASQCAGVLSPPRVGWWIHYSYVSSPVGGLRPSLRRSRGDRHTFYIAPFWDRFSHFFVFFPSFFAFFSLLTSSCPF